MFTLLIETAKGISKLKTRTKDEADAVKNLLLLNPSIVAVVVRNPS